MVALNEIEKDINLVKGEHAVLLIHGLSGTPLEMQYVARMLHKAGFSVRAPHFSGYGYEKGGETKSWQEWYGEVVEHFDDLKRKYKTVSVCGLCIGAVLALNLAAERGDEVAGLSLLATTLYFDGWSIPWYRFLLPLGYYTPFRYFYSYREREPYGLKNEQLRAWIAREMAEKSTSAAGSARIPMSGIFETDKLIKTVKRNISRATSPALIMHSLEDDTSSVKSADFVEKHIGSRQVRKIFLDDCYHILTLDKQKDVVARETIRFFNEVIAAVAPPSSQVELDKVRVA
ncbi:MAG TPA: alpha/beta fold hydrolase [Burkholderiales bacterium]|nr:alpha/beta fold hydrolase [Burkholderiales bacterium]